MPALFSSRQEAEAQLFVIGDKNLAGQKRRQVRDQYLSCRLGTGSMMRNFLPVYKSS